ncbi:phospholipase-like protein [Tanacetum coccineum]
MKSKDPDAVVPPLDETLKRITEPDPEAISQNKLVINEFHRHFKLKDNPKLKKSTRRLLRDKPSGSFEGEVGKIEDQSTDLLASTSTVKIETIGDLTPVPDFEAMISRRDSPEWVSKAIYYMKNKVIDLVESSYQGDTYPKSLECLFALRKGYVLSNEIEAGDHASSWFVKPEDYVCKVIIRSKLNYFWFIKQKLDVKSHILFRSTCFGPWLDLMLFDHEPLLIDYMPRRQHKFDDQHHDMPLIYYMEGHKLHFGRREFSLITDFCFGTGSFDLHSSGGLKFWNRIFSNKIGFSITNLDIIGVIEDEVIFGKLSDDDAIHLCLLLALEVIFMGRLLTFNVDDTLFSLVENIESWNSFPWGEHLWCHLYDEIKNLKERHGDEHYYRLFKDRNYVPTYTLSGFVFAFQALLFVLTGSSIVMLLIYIWVRIKLLDDW